MGEKPEANTPHGSGEGDKRPRPVDDTGSAPTREQREIARRRMEAARKLAKHLEEARGEEKHE